MVGLPAVEVLQAVIVGGIAQPLAIFLCERDPQEVLAPCPVQGLSVRFLVSSTYEIS